MQSAHARRGARLHAATIEALEARELLSASPSAKAVAVVRHPKQVITKSHLLRNARPNPSQILKTTVKAKPRSGGVQPLFHTAPTAASNTPASFRHAYGVDLVNFSGIAGDGTGQTIVIVDAFDDPALVNSTDPGFATSDLAMFDAQFGLPDPPSFTKLNESGGTSLPSVDTTPNSSWRLEEALDVEWAHAMAPNAKIILMEADAATLEDLIGDPTFGDNGAVGFARTMPGVSVISMSFGASESQVGGETSYDTFMTTPVGHTGITFLASTGDSGSPGDYPAYSPGVVAVGGTSLTLSGGNYSSETAWGGSGGGLSASESKPSYQSSLTQVQTSSGPVTVNTRSIPDLSIDADPQTGAAVYDSYDGGTATPWAQVGGTSLSAPAIAGLIAVANQGRALHGQAALNGATEVLPTLYSMSAADYHDITSGSNGGYNASSGYDAVTGRGTPIANLWVADLAGLSQPAINNLYVKKDGTFLDQWINSPTPGQGAPTQQLVASAAHSILFFGATGNDTLTLDYSGGNFSGVLVSMIVNGSATGSNAIDFLGTTGSDVLTVTNSSITPSGGFGSSPIQLLNIQTIQLQGGSGGSDAINVIGSPAAGYIIDGNTSPAIGTANVAVSVSGTSTAIAFASTQYLASLSIAPTDSVTLLASAVSGGKLLVTGGLSIMGNGVLDLANNVMVVQGGNLGAISTLIAAGFASGTWNGTGIRSSSAATNMRFTTALGVIANTADGVTPLYTQFDGYNASATDILVRYTRYGDADLNGTLNGADYQLIDAGFGANMTGWVHGDFNYDNLVNGTDFTLIDNSFNQQAAGF